MLSLDRIKGHTRTVELVTGSLLITLGITCSSMLAKAFARVGYPIRPSPSHHSQITPKDFDLLEVMERVLDVIGAPGGEAKSQAASG